MKSRLQHGDSIVLCAWFVSVCLFAKVVLIYPLNVHQACGWVVSCRQRNVVKWHQAHDGIAKGSCLSDIPLTCAKASSFLHYQDPRITAWHACSAAPGWREHRKLKTTVQATRVSQPWLYPKRQTRWAERTPVNNPHDGLESPSRRCCRSVKQEFRVVVMTGRWGRSSLCGGAWRIDRLLRYTKRLEDAHRLQPCVLARAKSRAGFMPDISGSHQDCRTPRSPR